MTVATVPTVYGIETGRRVAQEKRTQMLQQYLPFTVLKPASFFVRSSATSCCNSTYRLRY